MFVVFAGTTPGNERDLDTYIFRVERGKQRRLCTFLKYLYMFNYISYFNAEERRINRLAFVLILQTNAVINYIIVLRATLSLPRFSQRIYVRTDSFLFKWLVQLSSRRENTSLSDEYRSRNYANNDAPSSAIPRLVSQCRLRMKYRGRRVCAETSKAISR